MYYYAAASRSCRQDVKELNLGLVSKIVCLWWVNDTVGKARNAAQNYTHAPGQPVAVAGLFQHV